MESFFEKLKKGMGIEIEEEEEKKPEMAKPRVRKPKKPKMPKIKAESIEPVFKKIEISEMETEIIQKVPEPEKEEETETKEPSFAEAMEEKTAEEKEEWFESEGQLAIDVYQTGKDLVVQSAIAGVKSEDLDISIEDDVITIKGRRKKPNTETGDYFTQECYWGSFSRQIILPVEVDPNRVEASMKEGVLTIRLPKIERERKRKIAIKE